MALDGVSLAASPALPACKNDPGGWSNRGRIFGCGRRL